MRQASAGDASWRAGAISALVLAAVLLTMGKPLAEQPPAGLPNEPMLRIDPKGHVAPIRRIAMDGAERFAVTASDDQTARVWSLPDGKLQRVIRLPSDQGDIGKAYAVALSPDGATVAVGGWTGPPGDHNIFLFDRASGVLKKRLGKLPNVVHHLAYSQDGRRLAATLGGRNGIRVFDATNDFKELPSDRSYQDDSYWADFATDGRLVTASFDGSIRLYAPGRYETPIKTVKDDVVSKPFSAVFSRDGTRIAVGNDERIGVVVLSGDDLSRLYVPDIAGFPKGGNVEPVGWSADDRSLFFAGGLPFTIRRWEDGGRGHSMDIRRGLKNTTMQIVPMRDGRMVFADVIGFGVIDPGGSVTRIQDTVGLNWRGRSAVLRTSADGKTVQMDAVDPDHTLRFSLPQRLVYVDSPADESLASPTTDAPGVSIADWRMSYRPTVNGKPLSLRQYERALSLAIVPGTDHFVLGADWSLRLFNASGRDLWPNRVPTPTAAWGVIVTADRRLVVVAFGDGTIRWRRLADGKEILALFIHPDRQRWVAWTPQGYFDASTGADDLIGWLVNRGYDAAPDFFPASHFRDHYYRPDVIARVLDTLDPETAAREADLAAGRKTPKAVPVANLLTPVVQIRDPADGSATDRAELALTYSARMPTPDPILRVEALVDGTKVPGTDRELLTQADTRVGKLELKLPPLKLPPADATDSPVGYKVSVIAYNANGASDPASIRVVWRGPRVDVKPTLYVVAVGISHYRDKDTDGKYALHYAAKDADDFVAATKAQEKGLYAKVITHTPGGSLRDQAATRDAILDELDWILHQVTSSDVAMVMISGHGIKTPDQRYRLLPYDYDPARIERTTITDVELQQYLAKIGGKTLFFFDTCYSAGVLGKALDFQPDVDKFANELKAAENGIVVFASSTGNQLSHEDDDWRNGVFTKAVVEGMGGAAARPQMQVISTSDLEGYVSRRVKELTKGNQTPMTAKPKTIEDFWIAAVRQ